MITTSSEEEQPKVAAGSHGMTARNKEMILIEEYSGYGKSALASKLKAWTSKIESGLVVQGNFEITTKVPYSGVIQAFAAICNNLKQARESDIESKRASVMKIGDGLISELGSGFQ